MVKGFIIGLRVVKEDYFVETAFESFSQKQPTKVMLEFSQCTVTNYNHNELMNNYITNCSNYIWQNTFLLILDQSTEERC